MLKSRGMKIKAIFTCPAARISKVLKGFRARKAITKILTIMFTELVFSHNFNTNKVNFLGKFNAFTLLPFLDQYRSLKMALRLIGPLDRFEVGAFYLHTTVLITVWKGIVSNGFKLVRNDSGPVPWKHSLLKSMNINY